MTTFDAPCWKKPFESTVLVDKEKKMVGKKRKMLVIPQYFLTLYQTMQCFNQPGEHCGKMRKC